MEQLTHLWYSSHCQYDWFWHWGSTELWHQEGFNSTHFPTTAWEYATRLIGVEPHSPLDGELKDRPSAVTNDSHSRKVCPLYKKERSTAKVRQTSRLLCMWKIYAYIFLPLSSIQNLKISVYTFKCKTAVNGVWASEIVWRSLLDVRSKTQIWPLAKPARRRVQSWLRARADTDPYCSPNCHK